MTYQRRGIAKASFDGCSKGGQRGVGKSAHLVRLLRGAEKVVYFVNVMGGDSATFRKKPSLHRKAVKDRSVCLKS
jgi:hypothetical protein